MYEFSWRPINWGPEDDKTGVNARIFVQTLDKNMMDLFLIQHGFDPKNADVKITSDDDYSDDDMITLKIFRVGSRKRDKIYQIATTTEIVMEIISTISVELLDTMSFGACALKGEIELFNRVQSLIEKLDYVYIRETNPGFLENMDEDAYAYRYPGYPGYPSSYEELSRDDDIDALTESLYNAANWTTDGIQPFTIESYISIFTRDYLLGKVTKTHGYQ